MVHEQVEAKKDTRQLVEGKRQLALQSEERRRADISTVRDNLTASIVTMQTSIEEAAVAVAENANGMYRARCANNTRSPAGRPGRSEEWGKGHQRRDLGATQPPSDPTADPMDRSSGCCRQNAGIHGPVTYLGPSDGIFFPVTRWRPTTTTRDERGWFA